jgi:hypothetical protein
MNPVGLPAASSSVAVTPFSKLCMVVTLPPCLSSNIAGVRPNGPMSYESVCVLRLSNSSSIRRSRNSRRPSAASGIDSCDVTGVNDEFSISYALFWMNGPKSPGGRKFGAAWLISSTIACGIPSSCAMRGEITTPCNCARKSSQRVRSTSQFHSS